MYREEHCDARDLQNGYRGINKTNSSHWIEGSKDLQRECNKDATEAGRTYHSQFFPWSMVKGVGSEVNFIHTCIWTLLRTLYIVNAYCKI